MMGLASIKSLDDAARNVRDAESARLEAARVLTNANAAFREAERQFEDSEKALRVAKKLLSNVAVYGPPEDWSRNHMESEPV